MVDGVLRSDSGASSHDSGGHDSGPGYGTIAAPWGFAARFSPRGLIGYWAEFLSLTPTRTGFLLGCCENPATVDALRAEARQALLETADPLQTLRCITTANSSAVCAVIDRDSIALSGLGYPGGAIATPGAAPEPMVPVDGRLVVRPLEHGATVLLSTGPVPSAGTLLNDCAGMHPDQLADRVIVGLGHGSGQSGSAAVLYRHPPEPLSIALPAEPGGLSVSRGRLRQWLTAAGVDSETCADVLLAVGEATANSTEHAVVGAPDDVVITLDACFEPGGLRLLVSDNGRWKPATESSGHRGHGVRLMNALMNSVELTTDQQGTTVTMVKELPR